MPPIDNYQICPYTGLRSFTEDEALYFKGREDDIDQAVVQLQRNKFLMLTGASGDGKSSLVYAGIIPNARAGFLKSKYTQWRVANFRPERTPLQNLCRALARELHIPNTNSVLGELSHGFSALIDLYKNSRCYIDMQSAEWLQANEKEKAALKREAANLVILVDQFEEFFTNPENYQQGAPSRDANLVLNLLLETARISLEEDLPVYVVFTMRSDYTGQCAAFRGLPEYIGFSQFFVPRLNRTQLQQVIEEPARLSGNRISRRLTERLIHDITEGVDQLPILQHALNQIWVAADEGQEEMDLIHYAMVGGLSKEELPDDQIPRFEKWFSTLSPEIKSCYHAPGLQNVLDAHTNKLYEQAADYFQSVTGKTIQRNDAKTIIRTAFTCLTKIDESRAVRNRMTLQEITDIIGNPSFDAPAVGCILNIFREPGNTFIHPFILNEDPDTKDLHPGQVLDITHESLIRNWQYLGRWAKEEFESYSISVDFEKQLNRWTENKRSGNYLLAIGPLTYFETWFRKAAPNAYWIARYLPENTSAEKKLDTANEVLSNTNEFFRQSDRKHIITRTIMRYGPRRIGIAIAILAFITFSSFVVKNFITRQNGYVLDYFRKRTLDLAKDPRLLAINKAALVAQELKLGQVTVDEVINVIPDTIQKLNVLNDISSDLIFCGGRQPANIIYRTLFLTDSLLKSYAVPIHDPLKLSEGLREINLYRAALELGHNYNRDTSINILKLQNAKYSARWVLNILSHQPPGFTDMTNLSLALENAIDHNAFTPQELEETIKLLSPFENGLQTPWLQSNYQKDKLMIRGGGSLGYGFSHNGLYQDLAYLYSASGIVSKALQCVDTLLANNQNYYQGDYGAVADNALNIAAIYYTAGKREALDSFVIGYCNRKKISRNEFYFRLLGRSQHSVPAIANLRLFFFMDEVQNMNLTFSGWEQLSFFAAKCREAIESDIHDRNEKSFLSALLYKDEGLLKARCGEQPGKEESVNQLFDKAVSFYQLVDSSWLSQEIPMTDMLGSDQIIAPRRFLFVYPDFKTEFHPEEPRSFYFFYFGDLFLDYILDNHLFDKFYAGNTGLDFISMWLHAYAVKSFAPSSFLVYKPRYEVLKKLAEELDRRKSVYGIDFNLLYLQLGEYAEQAGKLDEMVKYYDQVDLATIFNILRIKEFGGNVSNRSLERIGVAMKGYVKSGHLEKAVRLAAVFKNPVNRSSLYAFAATRLLVEKSENKNAQALIDSAMTEMKRVENTSGSQPNRSLIAYALTMANPGKNEQEAYTVIRNLPAKFKAMQSICRAYAFYNDLYKARSGIPADISGSDEAAFLTFILIGNAEDKKPTDDSWIQYESNDPTRRLQFIQYIDETD